MCGIAGVIAWDERYRVTRETLAAMSARIAHRGPDGEAFYLNHEREVTRDNPQCGFAFRRLAILDPDPRAMQPFTIGDKTIVFNGEIYNFRDLRAELSNLRPDYAWRTTGDTEVLLLAYDAWGEKCLERLNGMFAFAVWDEQATSLFLARDRMGQKPLYVTSQRGGGGATHACAFGSEVPALLSVPWVNRLPSAGSICHYLRWGYVPTDGSVYESVTQVAPGTFERIRGDSVSTASYFKLNGLPESGSREVGSVRQLVRRAVERQLVTDVPLGCFLSGGVDSSVIAASMRAALGPGKSFETFSIGFDDPRYDESAYACSVAKHLGSKHHAFTVRADAGADLPRIARAHGEPFGDSSSLPTYYLSRETRGHVKVALSGDGGDELFGGYDRYRAMRIASRIPRVPAAVLAPALAFMPGTHPKSKAARAKRFVAALAAPLSERYALYLRLFPARLLGELLVSEFAASGEATWDEIAVGHDNMLKSGRDAVTAAVAVDRVTYLPGDLLTKVDRAAMLHSLEVRSPFMDHELVQFAAGLTTDQLLKGGPKRMLREAFSDDLPEWVFKRKKMGFAVPIGEWFRGDLRPMLRDHLFGSDSFARRHFHMKVLERLVEEHETEKVDHSQRLYALLMLELWWRTAR